MTDHQTLVPEACTLPRADQPLRVAEADPAAGLVIVYYAVRKALDTLTAHPAHTGAADS